MENSSIIAILTAIIGALGIKEIWQIWKKKIDNQNQTDILKLHQGHNSLHEVILEQKRIINEMKERIISLEEKIEVLIEENRDCAVKLARMEERLLAHAKKKVTKKEQQKRLR